MFISKPWLILTKSMLVANDSEHRSRSSDTLSNSFRRNLYVRFFLSLRRNTVEKGVTESRTDTNRRE